MSNESVQLIYPSDEMVKNAAVSGMDAYRALCAEADADYPEFWAKRAREMITWKQPFTQSLDESNAPFFKWFADGKLNVSYNCLDRQVEAGLGEKVAIIFRSRQRRSNQGYLQGDALQGRQVRQCPARHGRQEG